MQWSYLADPVLMHIHVIEAFRRHLNAAGCAEQRRKTLVSHHDSSIRFTNSTISVLKPFLQQGSIPAGGVFLAQPSLRTHNLRMAADPNAAIGFASYFIALGALAPPEVTADLAAVGQGLLVDALRIPSDRIVLRVASIDVDLLGISHRISRGSWVEIDGYEPRRYRHHFGMDGVSGRNFNFAIRGTCGLRDVGNLIVIERDGVPIAVEIAFGVSTLLSRLYDLHHPLLAAPVATLLPISGERGLLLADAVVAATTLTMEGLRPTSRGRGGNLRDYFSFVANEQRPSITAEQVARLAEMELSIQLSTSPPDSAAAALAPSTVGDLFIAGIDRGTAPPGSRSQRGESRC